VSLFSIIIVIPVERSLKLIIVRYVKVYKSFIITVGGLILLTVIVSSDKVVRLPSFPGISSYRPIDKLLALTLYLSFIKTVIDTYNELDILGELVKSIYSSDFVLNIFLKAVVKLSDISVVVLI
jgi:hypothetical protein